MVLASLQRGLRRQEASCKMTFMVLSMGTKVSGAANGVGCVWKERVACVIMDSCRRTLMLRFWSLAGDLLRTGGHCRILHLCEKYCLMMLAAFISHLKIDPPIMSFVRVLRCRCCVSCEFRPAPSAEVLAYYHLHEKVAYQMQTNQGRQCYTNRSSNFDLTRRVGGVPSWYASVMRTILDVYLPAYNFVLKPLVLLEKSFICSRLMDIRYRISYSSTWIIELVAALTAETVLH